MIVRRRYLRKDEYIGGGDDVVVIIQDFRIDDFYYYSNFDINVIRLNNDSGSGIYTIRKVRGKKDTFFISKTTFHGNNQERIVEDILNLKDLRTEYESLISKGWRLQRVTDFPLLQEWRIEA